jgi:hypothetical protein
MEGDEDLAAGPREEGEVIRWAEIEILIDTLAYMYGQPS